MKYKFKIKMWPSGWYPCRLDRYIIAKFLGTYFFAIVLIISIAVVFDYNENIDRFTSNNAPNNEIIHYYSDFIPYYAVLFSPIFVFIAVIFFTSKLAGNSEIIAMLSAGVSMNRIFANYLFCALLIGGFNFYLSSELIPSTSITRLAFENRYKKKKKDPTSTLNAQLMVKPGVVAYIERFDGTNKTGYNFSLDKFENKKLVEHLTCTSLTYDTISETPYHWKLYGVTIRNLKSYKEKVRFENQIDSVIPMDPTDLLPTRNFQETMTNSQLIAYIAKQRARGNAMVQAYEVEYYKRFANSFASFILATIGLSLSSRKRKGGMGIALGFGLALSAIYVLMQGVTATFATKAGLMPQLAVWIPNIIYFVIAAYLFRKAPR